MEPRYIERLLHGKRWDKNRDRTFLLVIEKTRYIETRYRELRLYISYPERSVHETFTGTNVKQKINCIQCFIQF